MIVRFLIDLIGRATSDVACLDDAFPRNGVGEASPLCTSSKACKPRRFAYILTPPRALPRLSYRLWDAFRPCTPTRFPTPLSCKNGIRRYSLGSSLPGYDPA